MVSDGLALNNGVEATVLVGGVLDGADVTVGLDQGVFTLDDVTLANFLLGLDVAGVGVVNVVGEGVVGGRVVVVVVVTTAAAVNVVDQHDLVLIQWGMREVGGLVVQGGQKAGVGHGGDEGRQDDELQSRMRWY